KESAPDSRNIDSVWIIYMEISELLPSQVNFRPSFAELPHHYDLRHPQRHHDRQPQHVADREAEHAAALLLNALRHQDPGAVDRAVVLTRCPFMGRLPWTNSPPPVIASSRGPSLVNWLLPLQ